MAALTNKVRILNKSKTRQNKYSRAHAPLHTACTPYILLLKYCDTNLNTPILIKFAIAHLTEIQI
jgi:hypothetical protein